MIAIQNAQLLAIEGRLENTMDAFERKIRRWFSKEHATPYLDTFKFPWDELLLHYYESNLANKSFNEVFDLAVEEYLPDFVQAAEEADQAYAESLLEEQAATLKAKKARDGETALPGVKTQPGAVKTKGKQQSVKNKAKSSQIKNKPTPKTMSLKFDENDPEDI